MKKALYSLFFIFSLFFTQPLFAAGLHYTILIDAGSTGSRLHLYQYETNSKIPVIQDLFSKSINRGLSSFANHPEAAGQSLTPLLDEVSKLLATKNIDAKTVPLQLLATAGMRLLSENQQALIYKNVRLYLESHYSFPVQDLKTIPGDMEGLFGWLDINYLLKSFNSAGDHTRGSLDMGGASTQIVFTEARGTQPENEIQLSLGGNRYTVFTKSFLGLGLMKAQAAIRHSSQAASCFPSAYPLSAENSGLFNFSSCGSLYQDFIEHKQVAAQLPPLPEKEFIGYSGIYHTFHFFAVDTKGSESLLEKQVQSICAQSWEDLRKQHADMPEKLLSISCANGVYLSKLLYGAYHLKGKELRVAKKIGQQDIDWTLGALLYQLTQT